MISSISLVMIVRNEARVIARCLASVMPIISYWVVCDTGSTDGTQEIIRSLLAGIPGELHEDPWVDFAHNRTLALARARGKSDYHLMIDADMTLAIKAGFDRSLRADGYYLRFEGPCDFRVIRLVSDRHEWKYVGAAHEYICSETGKRFGTLDTLTMTHHDDGAAGRGKYWQYIKLLENELKSDPGNPRSTFYMAQTYANAGEITEALKWYDRRAVMEGWDEETWCAKYAMGLLLQQKGMDWNTVLTVYLEAYRYRPWRLEPLYRIARFYRENSQYHLGYVFSLPCTKTPYPDDFLFVERSVYEYEMPTEYAICCYWLGKHEEAVRVNEAILQCPNLPDNYRQSAERNLKLSLEHIREPKSEG